MFSLFTKSLNGDVKWMCLMKKHNQRMSFSKKFFATATPLRHFAGGLLSGPFVPLMCKSQLNMSCVINSFKYGWIVINGLPRILKKKEIPHLAVTSSLFFLHKDSTLSWPHHFCCFFSGSGKGWKQNHHFECCFVEFTCFHFLALKAEANTS